MLEECHESIDRFSPSRSDPLLSSMHKRYSIIIATLGPVFLASAGIMTPSPISIRRTIFPYADPCFEIKKVGPQLSMISTPCPFKSLAGTNQGVIVLFT